jgi:hypothetical protein
MADTDPGFIGGILAGLAGLGTAIAAALHSRGVQKELGKLSGAVDATNTRLNGLDSAAAERRLEGRRFEDRVIAELKEERRLREAREAEVNRMFATLFEKVDDVRLEVASLEPKKTGP